MCNSFSGLVLRSVLSFICKDKLAFVLSELGHVLSKKAALNLCRAVKWMPFIWMPCFCLLKLIRSRIFFFSSVGLKIKVWVVFGLLWGGLVGCFVFFEDIRF